jgi:hypothetical protein
MQVLNTTQVKHILASNPEALFSLQPVKVVVQGSNANLIAGYHIYEGHLPKMINVTGQEIWNLVPFPGT